jgi:ABC-type lipoprotein release transport system permease subunit
VVHRNLRGEGLPVRAKAGAYQPERRYGASIDATAGKYLTGSLWAARLVEALLFHLEPRDPVTFGGAAVVLVVVGVLAAWLPAHRAARLDPVTVLREG